jgi:hypothetical protein
MSNITTYRLQLDVKDIASQLSISVPQGNTGRRLAIQLVDDGNIFEIGRGSRAIFVATKPNGTTIYNDCVIQNNYDIEEECIINKGLILYDISQQTVSSTGEVVCEIDLYDFNGHLISSPRFSIIVYEAARYQVDLGSESESTFIDHLTDIAIELETSENKREANELTRMENESIRSCNEAERIQSTNTLRDYLGDNNVISINQPNEIFAKFDNKQADAYFNNYIRVVEDEEIKGIAIIGSVYNEGDTNVTDTEMVLNPNTTYFYTNSEGGFRFATLDTEAPEKSVFEALVGSVSEWYDKAEEKVNEITQNENDADGFLRLDGSGLIPISKIPSLVVVNRQTYYVYNDTTEDDINAYLVELIKSGEAQPNDYLDIIKLVEVPSVNDTSVLIPREVVLRSYIYLGSARVDRLSDAQILNGWKLIGTDYASYAAYAERSNESYTADRIKGVLVRFGTEADFNSSDKRGLYVITPYSNEVLKDE